MVSDSEPSQEIDSMQNIDTSMIQEPIHETVPKIVSPFIAYSNDSADPREDNTEKDILAQPGPNIDIDMQEEKINKNRSPKDQGRRMSRQKQYLTPS